MLGFVVFLRDDFIIGFSFFFPVFIFDWRRFSITILIVD